MLIKIHSRGAGRGSGPTGYLTGEKDHTGKVRDVAPVVLRGDAEQTRELIDSLDFKRKYTSGVLSFSEPDIKPEQKQQIMDSWELALFPGMDKNQYSVFWVEHRDKGRLELNFVIPNVELQTGKRLQPYFDPADRYRVDAWQTLTNHVHGLTDPKDPERAQSLIPAKDLPKDRQEATEAITRGLLILEPENRTQVITALSEVGFEVVRQTKSSISIKDPDGGRNLRLKGAIYAEDYRGGEALRRAREDAERSYREDSESRIREATERYRAGIRKRIEDLRVRYSEAEGARGKDREDGLDPKHIARNSADRALNLVASADERALGLVRVQERDAATRQHGNDEGRKQVGAVRENMGRPERQNTALLPSCGVDENEPNPARTNALRIAESTRRRATERTRENERHATPDRPTGRIAQAINELAARVHLSFRRSRELISKVWEVIEGLEKRVEKSKGIDLER